MTSPEMLDEETEVEEKVGSPGCSDDGDAVVCWGIEDESNRKSLNLLSERLNEMPFSFKEHWRQAIVQDSRSWCVEMPEEEGWDVDLIMSFGWEAREWHCGPGEWACCLTPWSGPWSRDWDVVGGERWTEGDAVWDWVWGSSITEHRRLQPEAYLVTEGGEFSTADREWKRSSESEGLSWIVKAFSLVSRIAKAIVTSLIDNECNNVDGT